MKKYMMKRVEKLYLVKSIQITSRENIFIYLLHAIYMGDFLVGGQSINFVVRVCCHCGFWNLSTRWSLGIVAKIKEVINASGIEIQEHRNVISKYGDLIIEF